VFISTLVLYSMPQRFPTRLGLQSQQ